MLPLSWGTCAVLCCPEPHSPGLREAEAARARALCWIPRAPGRAGPTTTCSSVTKDSRAPPPAPSWGWDSSQGTRPCLEELLCLAGCWIRCWSPPALTVSCQSCAAAPEGLGSRSPLRMSWSRIPVWHHGLSWAGAGLGTALSAVAHSAHDWSVLLHGTIPSTPILFLTLLLPHSSAGGYVPYYSLIFNTLPLYFCTLAALGCPSPSSCPVLPQPCSA